MGSGCISLWVLLVASAPVTAPCTVHIPSAQQVLTSWRCSPCRDMNAATSQEVFAGPYLTDVVKRQKFSDCFQDMTQGFLAFPLCIPGTAVWKGKQGRLWIIDLLEEAAGKSKAAMKVGFGMCSAWHTDLLFPTTQTRGRKAALHIAGLCLPAGRPGAHLPDGLLGAALPGRGVRGG